MSRRATRAFLSSTQLRCARRDLTPRNCRPDCTRAQSRVHPLDDCCRFPVVRSQFHAFFLSLLWGLLSLATAAVVHPAVFQPATLFLSPRHRADVEGHQLAIVKRHFADCRLMPGYPARMESSSFELPTRVGVRLQ